MDNLKLSLLYVKSLPNNKGTKDARYIYLKKLCEYTDKNLVHLSAQEIFDIFICKIKINDSELVNNYRSVYSNYINWYVKNIEDDNEVVNLFNYHELLTYETLLRSISINTNYYNESRFNQLCNSFNKNHEYIEAVCRLFYEGCPSIGEVVSLSVSQINYADKTIEFSTGRVKISDRLIYCLETVRHQSIWVQNNDKNRVLDNIFNGSVFKFVPNAKTTNDIEKRKKSASTFMSKFVFGEYNIYYKELYLSGILNYIYSNYTSDEICDMFLTESKSDISEIKKICDACACKYEAKRLKFILIPYIVKLKYNAE